MYNVNLTYEVVRLCITVEGKCVISVEVYGCWQVMSVGL